jgi:hypothetical protein
MMGNFVTKKNCGVIVRDWDLQNGGLGVQVLTL